MRSIRPEETDTQSSVFVGMINGPFFRIYRTHNLVTEKKKEQGQTSIVTPG